jgi:Tfp pilus assembly protein PilN
MKAVNLIPADQHTHASVPVGRSGGGAYVVLGLLAGLALMALLYGTAGHNISSNREQVASLQARTAQAQARAAQLTPYANFVALREQRVQDVTQLVDSRFDWANAFYELGRVLPADASIGSLDGTVGSTSGSGSASAAASGASAGSTVTSATPPGSVPTFSLTGCATSQSEVAHTLERLRLIDGVDEVQLQSATKSGSAGGGGGSGASCEGGHVSFSVQVTFDALPSVPTAGHSASVTTVAVTTSGSTSPSSASGTATPASPAPASSSGVDR